MHTILRTDIVSAKNRKLYSSEEKKNHYLTFLYYKNFLFSITFKHTIHLFNKINKHKKHKIFLLKRLSLRRETPRINIIKITFHDEGLENYSSAIPGWLQKKESEITIGNGM